LFCLAHDSPPIDRNEQKEIDQNEMLTAHQGRDPSLRLSRNAKHISIKDWGGEILNEMQGYAELLDNAYGTGNHSASLKVQQQAVDDPECTPSAKMLSEMSQKGEGFYQYAMRMSQQHHEAFTENKLSDEKIHFYQDLTSSSLAKQKQIEENDSLSFTAFLQHYFTKSL